MNRIFTHTDLAEQVLSATHIPALFGPAMEALQLINPADPDHAAAADAIARDADLAEMIIRQVHLESKDFHVAPAGLRAAVQGLNSDHLRMMIIGIHLSDWFTTIVDKGGFDWTSLRSRAVFGTTAGRELARITGVADADSVSLAAMIQDIGMIALHSAFGDEYLQVIESAGPSHRQLPVFERRALRLTHCLIGSEIAERWSLPESVVAAIGCHHDSSTCSAGVLDICRLIELACCIGDMLTTNFNPADFEEIIDLSRHWFGMCEDEICDVLRAVADQHTSVADRYALTVNHKPEIDAYLIAAANVRRNLLAMGVTAGPSPRRFGG